MGKPKRFYKRWTDGEVMFVKTMKSSGHLPEDIAPLIGRTVGSVRNIYYSSRHAAIAAVSVTKMEGEEKPSLYHVILAILGIRK